MIKDAYYEASKQEFSVNYRYDSHKHMEYEINYICAGRCVMNVQEQNVVLRSGECIILPSWQNHNFIVDGVKSCQIVQFLFSSKEVEEELEHLVLFQQSVPCFKIANCTDVLEELLVLERNKDLVQDSECKNLLYRLSVQRLFVLLSIHIEHSSKIQREYEDSILKPAVTYIENHYEQSISIDALAKRQKVSGRYLRKLFMQELGFCASDYITMLRIEKAKDLLKNSRRSISEIALDVGYNSFQYFSMMFKKKVGLTPSDFRKQYE